MRFFLGVGKYTPNTALYGETGWIPPVVNQWTCISRHFVRLSCINILRVNKRIANWANNKASNKCRNWFYNVFEYFAEHNLNVNLNTPVRHGFVKRVNDAAMEAFISTWRMDVNSIVGPSGRGRNKLRTYRTFKKTMVLNNIVNLFYLLDTEQHLLNLDVELHL
jgi:hypothetical protein